MRKQFVELINRSSTEINLSGHSDYLEYAVEGIIYGKYFAVYYSACL